MKVGHTGRNEAFSDICDDAVRVVFNFADPDDIQ